MSPLEAQSQIWCITLRAIWSCGSVTPPEARSQMWCVCDFVSSIWTCSLSELVDLGYMVCDFVSLENLPKKI